VEVGLAADTMDNNLTSSRASVSLVDVDFILFLCVCFFRGFYQGAMAFAGGCVRHKNKVASRVDILSNQQ